VTKRVMALATRVECDKEGDGFGGRSNGKEGGKQATATSRLENMSDL
jgi:hypothetical protein